MRHPKLGRFYLGFLNTTIGPLGAWMSFKLIGEKYILLLEHFRNVVFPSHLVSSNKFLFSSVILQNGSDCHWMDTREVLIVNPTSSDQVDPDYVESEKKLEKWYSKNPKNTLIATGFIASTPQNIPTTLKRDGSDFSAAIMGALVRARQVTIWTDVDGVYSADPKKGVSCPLFSYQPYLPKLLLTGRWLGCDRCLFIW